LKSLQDLPVAEVIYTRFKLGKKGGSFVVENYGTSIALGIKLRLLPYGSSE